MHLLPSIISSFLPTTVCVSVLPIQRALTLAPLHACMCLCVCVPVQKWTLALLRLTGGVIHFPTREGPSGANSENDGSGRDDGGSSRGLRLV